MDERRSRTPHISSDSRHARVKRAAVPIESRVIGDDMEKDWVDRCMQAAAAKEQIKPEIAKSVELILRGNAGCRKLTGLEIATSASAILLAAKRAALADDATAGATE